MSEPAPRPPALTRDLLQQLFDELLPGRAPVAEVTRFAEGTVSGAYQVTFADAQADPVVVKLPAPEYPWAAAKEVHVYRLLAEHAIPAVPQVLAFEESAPLLDGLPCTVLTMQPGEPLSGVSEDMDESELFDIYRQLGASLAAIHRIPMDAYGYIVADIVRPQPDNVRHMNSHFVSLLREFQEHGGDTDLAAAVIEHVSQRNAVFAACTQPVLCHGDFHSGNLLVQRDEAGQWQLTGVIDVENAHAADPLVDIVRTEAFSIEDSRPKRAGLLAGYGLAGDEWPDAWRERMHTYRIALAIELWNWFTISGAPQHLPGLEQELRQLLAIS